VRAVQQDRLPAEASYMDVRRALLVLPGVVCAALLAVVVLPTPAQAAVPNGTVTPVANCFWDNEDGTVSVSLGYRSRNAATVTEAVGTNNRFTIGNANRGQPTTFLPGTNNNVFVADVTYGELWSGIDWRVAGLGVDLSSAELCSSKPVPADGNALAVVAFGLTVTAIGSYTLSGRHKRRRLRT
jgi:hypothetical protein